MRSLPAKRVSDYVPTSPLAQSTMLGPRLIPACRDATGKDVRRVNWRPSSNPLQVDCVSAFDGASSWKDTELEEVNSSL